MQHQFSKFEMQNNILVDAQLRINLIENAAIKCDRGQFEKRLSGKKDPGAIKGSG